MSSIDDKTKTNGTNRGDYRMPTNGPHRFVKKEVNSVDEAPPYVIAITKKDKDEEVKPSRPTSKHQPEEMRAKAKMLLNNPNLDSEQRKVLKEILGPDEPPKPT